MKRTIITTVTAALLVVAGAQASDAAVARDFIPEDYDASEHFAAGDGLCVPWAGTFHEVRTGGYRIVVPPGGRVDGEAHVNGAIDGLVELIPDDPGLPTYTGRYREKVDGIFVGTDADGQDLLRVAQYRLRLPLTGTDGSTLRLTLAGKVTVNAKGVTTVGRDVYDCG
jgi:hypothetical protein